MRQVLDRLTAIWRQGRKIVFLGVGSPLRADDAVGLLIVSELEKQLPATPERELRFYLGEAAPENFTGVIREFGPDYVVLFDAAALELTPGEFRLIEHDQISGVSFSTHVLPLKIIANYLKETTGCEVVVVGVQPKLLEFGYEMTAVVKQAAVGFVGEFKGIIERLL